MATINLTPALRTEYENLFNSCVIRPERVSIVNDTIAALQSGKERYVKVSKAMGIPWHFVAVIHNMEASRNFGSHLHNGDPLTNRTIQVPAGRPKTGMPPFTWEDSATDALAMKGLGSQTDWSLAGILYQLERYNGFGYRQYHPHVKSPYLWGFSNHYTSGKYVADGTWSDIAVSKQCGAAVLLRRMAETGVIDFADQPAPKPGAQPIVVRHSMKKPTDPLEVAKAEKLQQWLNTFPGIFVKPDGIPGDRTSDAFKKVTGVYLPGDPRGR
jgi:lysozyme family protein